MARTGRGLFITLEGGEGSGKTTLARTLAARLEERGHSVCLTREPGGTELGQAVQRGLMTKEGLSPLAELLLFAADRAQHIAEVIHPALDSRQTVICDRFADSTLAYQGYGRGINIELIRKLNEAATGGLTPDVTLLLDLPPEVGLAREGEQLDVTGREPIEFHERVRAGFLAIAQEEPGRFEVLDATLSTEEVAERALEAVKQRV